MIKIDKNPNKIPPTLFDAKTVHAREELIKAKSYIKKKYDDCYKTTEIKEALEKLYNYKCVYCEAQVGRTEVEHFRPKSVYWWLAFSWDNLMRVCSDCNSSKNNFFDTLDDMRASFDPEDLAQIHNLNDKYNRIEKNKFFNPEKEDPEALLIFEIDGKINSNDDRIKYTIEKCKLNRLYLKRFRYEVYKDYKKKVLSYFAKYLLTKNAVHLNTIKELKNMFVEDSHEPKKTFLAYRRYIVRHFLNEK